MDKVLKYRNEVQPVYESGPIESNCNMIAFVNVGTADVEVNGEILSSGDRTSWDGNKGELDTTVYTARFADIGTKQLNVYRKIYVP